MKRLVYIVNVFVILFGITISKANAQRPAFPSFAQLDRSDAVTVGIKGGVALPSFLYSDPALKGLPRDILLRPVGGLFVEIPLGAWSLTPQVRYGGMGMSSTYQYKNSYEVHYLALSNYLDFSSMVSYKIRLSNDFFVYAFLSPGLGILLDGSLSLTQPGLDIPEVSIEMTKANMKEFDAFILGGVGTQYFFNMSRFSMTIKLEIGFHQGIVNSFSSKEIDETALPTNVHAYNNTGKRYNQGIEALLGIGIPLKFDKLQCGNFGNGNKSKRINSGHSTF